VSAPESLSRLSPESRSTSLEQLEAGSFDVLVVGGGITGAGVALDAATRGLSVALVEKRDFAAGTSSRSSKLIHGGLRYLEQRDFGLVREALRERALLLETIAPHLVEPVPFIFPLKNRAWERAYVGAGIGLYDALAGRHAAVPRHRHLSRTAALELAPSLRPDALTGAIRYHDARTDDARFVIALVRTAVARGALAISGVRVDGIGSREGGSREVALHDSERGADLRLRARVVVNATGIWSGELERLAGVAQPLNVRASKGVHLLVPRGRIRSEVALILRTERSVLFVIPWGAHWIIGTTDTEWHFDRDHPAASRQDIRYLLDHVNEALEEPLGDDDVVGVYAGLRPLVDEGGEGETTAVSREHVVRRPAPGIVTVAGGKYTTYRVMARDAIDAAAEELGEPVGESATESLPLQGAEGLAVARGRAHTHPAAAAVGSDAVDHLLERYGAFALVLLDMVAGTPELGEPIPGAPGYLRVEVSYAVAAEGALHLDDVLTRRTRISIETPDRGRAAALPVAREMAAPLGWDDAAVHREADRYLERLEAEIRAAREPDDEHADAVRAAVRDPRLAA
jgi:glycerol-3-phosphate dehydrogenase